MSEWPIYPIGETLAFGEITPMVLRKAAENCPYVFGDEFDAAIAAEWFEDLAITLEQIESL